MIDRLDDEALNEMAMDMERVGLILSPSSRQEILALIAEVRDGRLTRSRVEGYAVDCAHCGTSGCWQENPFAAEINDDHSLYALCEKCRAEAAEDI